MRRSTSRPGLTLATLGLLLAWAPAAFAASSVDLTVSGLITPSACTPTLSNDGAVDYGKIAARDLSAEESTWLPKIVLQLRVNCDAPTLFALRGTDNRRGTAHKDDGYGYGLGLINGDQKLGTYLLVLRNPFSETAVIHTLMSLNNGDTWWDFPDGTWLVAHQLAAFGNSDSGNAAPIALQSVSVDLEIATSIAPSNELNLTQQVPLDGSATADLFYL